MATLLTLGVEEEYFAVDAGTRRLVVDATPILTAVGGPTDGYPSYADEFRLSMIESRTSPSDSLAGLRAEITVLRRRLAEAAAGSGHRIVAAGTVPLADWRTQVVNPKPRFLEVARDYARMADEHVVCGCHVHVGIDDRDVAIEVMNRVRPWLPVLLALSASSPFWMGEDTGYASYRSVIMSRWPMAGVPSAFGSYEEYTRAVQAVIEAGAAVDVRQAFWDVRPGVTHATLEFRVADSCPSVDDTILQAGLCRALVRTCLDELATGRPPVDHRPELVRAARWRAGRFGLSDRLLDPLTGELLPAGTVVDRVVAHVAGALDQSGDRDEVTALVERVRHRRSSAARQVARLAETDDLVSVIDLLVEETAGIDVGPDGSASERSE